MKGNRIKPLLAAALCAWLTLQSAAAFDLQGHRGARGLAPEGGGEKVAFAAVKAVIDSRCISCHAAKPTQPGFAAPPAGVALETSEQIRAQAQRIHQQVVVARVMPLGNLTGITDAERALVGRWFAQGAKTD